MTQINSQTFFQAADDARDTSTLKVSGSQVSAVGHYTWQSTNHTAMQSFLSALQRDYGDTFVEAVGVTFQSEIQADKPLTARMVQDIKELAQSYTLQQNSTTRHMFEAGINQDLSLESSMNEALGSVGDALNADVKTILKDVLKSDLQMRFPLQGQMRLSSLALKVFILGNPTIRLAKEVFSGKSPLNNLPGSPVDKMTVITQLSTKPDALSFVLQKLGDIRTAFPTGNLTPQMVWSGCFGEEMSVPAASFSSMFETRLGDKLKQLSGGNAPGLTGMMKHMALDTAVNLLTGPLRNITHADFLDIDATLAPSKNPSMTAEEMMARDMCRRTGKMMGNDDKTVDTPPAITVNGQRFELLNAAQHKFTDAADKSDYLSGKPSSFSRAIAESIKILCGGPNADPRQVDALMVLCSQSPMRALVGQEGCVKNSFPVRLNEHAPTEITISTGMDGHVMLNIHTPDNPAVARNHGHVNLTYNVAADGSAHVTNLEFHGSMGVKVPNTAVEAVREGMTDACYAGVPRKDILANMEIAAKQGNITEAELATLRYELANLPGPTLSELAEALQDSARRAIELDLADMAEVMTNLHEAHTNYDLSDSEHQALLDDLESYAAVVSLRNSFPAMIDSGANMDAVQSDILARIGQGGFSQINGNALLVELEKTVSHAQTQQATPSQAFNSVIALVKKGGASMAQVQAAINTALDSNTMSEKEVADILTFATRNLPDLTAKKVTVPPTVTCVAWRNSTNAHPLGVCEAAVSHWLDRIGLSGVGVASTLRPQACDARQALVESGRWTAAADLLGSLPAGSSVIDDYIPQVKAEGRLTADFDNLENLQPGEFRYFMAVRDTQGNGTGMLGHAMGMYCGADGKLSFFDPNRGIYTGDRAGVMQVVRDVFSGWPSVGTLVGNMPQHP